MKLLFLSQYFPPETGAGATRAATLKKYLSEYGWEVDVICEMPNYPSGVIPDKYRHRFSHVTDDKGGKVIRTWVIPTRRESFIQQICMFGSYMASSFLYGFMNPKNYDAIYATSPPIFSALSGLMLAKLFRIPFFFEVRDLWPDAAIETGYVTKKSISFKISKALEKWLYKEAILVIPVTHRSEKRILDTFPNARTSVIYNGVDIDYFNRVPNARSIVPEPFENNKFHVGYVGTIGVIHDLKTIILAAKKLENNADIVFHIIGDGSKSHSFKKLLSEYEPANVRWHGLKPHERIPAYISALDLALNPVYKTDVFESILTVKFFEYLACEVPVVNMAGGLLKEVGDASNAAVTIEPENPTLLAETIRSIKDDPKRIIQMQKHSRPFIKAFFDRKLWARELSDLLKTHLGYNSELKQTTTSIKQRMSQSGYNW